MDTSHRPNARRALRLVAVVLTLLLGSQAAALAAPSTVGPTVRVMIGVDDLTSPLVRDALSRGQVLTRAALPSARVVIGDMPAAAVAVLERHAAVRYVEVDRPVQAAAVSNDPYEAKQWALNNVGQEMAGRPGVADVDVDVEQAWAYTRGSRDVIVAVLDTGVDVAHPDLAANIWRNEGEIAGNGIDDDRNGYVDDVNGWDFANDDASLLDDATADGHGTHVAGIIAAVADNGIGVAGVAPNVRVLPLKFLGEDGGWTSDAVRAIEYAVAAGADVLNASWSGVENSSALNDAIAAFAGPVVVAAGNEGRDIDAEPTYPAAFPAKNLVSVASISNDGTRSSFSNYGRNNVDLGAPGSYVMSTVPGGYAYSSGTSMAAPHVAATFALMTSAAPAASRETLVSTLLDTVTPSSAMSGVTRTGGVLDTAAAVDALVRAEAANVEATRLAGSDRYATAAQISRTGFPSGAETVFVATSASFPDALSGAAAAARQGAPILLVTATQVPAATATELARLAPRRIVVLGGTAAVSKGVASELGRTTGATVSRLAGADRYATSAAIATSAFAPGVDVVYLATGAAFADALGAGAAAAREGGPVLLTAPNQLPDVIAATLRDLRPKRVVVLGGAAAVSDAVVTAAGRAADAPAVRRGGASRYATSAAITAAVFAPGVREVHLATGTSFPDALAGGAAAGVAGVPVLLVPSSGSLPAETVAELQRLAPGRLVVLGGTSAVSDEVLLQARLAVG